MDELRPLVRAFLRPRVRDVNDLEDVVQDALLRAARYRASEGEPDKLRAWILRVAENALRDNRRRRLRLPVREVETVVLDGFEGREPSPGDDADLARAPIVDAACERQALLACVGNALRELDASDQDVLDRFYGGAGRCRDVAREMHLAPDTVKSRLYRARRRLSLLVRRRIARGNAPGVPESVAGALEQSTPSITARGARCAGRRSRESRDGRAVPEGKP